MPVPLGKTRAGQPERASFAVYRDIKSQNYGTTRNSYSNSNNKDNTNSINPGRKNLKDTEPPRKYCLSGQEADLRGHCHRQRTEGVDVKARKKLIIASFLCLFFMVAEIIGGYLSRSLAIATDAAHLLTDFASFMISLFAIWIAGRPSTQRMSFGWYRAEVIGALASVVMIWAITAILVWLAIERVISGEYEVDAEIMLITSALAIVVNLIMGFQLQHSHSHGGGLGHGHSHSGVQHAHSHSHSHSHGAIQPQGDHTRAERVTTLKTVPSPSSEVSSIDASVTSEDISEPPTVQKNVPCRDAATSVAERPGPSQVEKEDENLNVRAAYIHVLGDVLQSVGVFVAALVIYFRPDWAIADPICTFIFSVIVLFTTCSILKDALLVLMEGSPDYLQYTEVMETFLGIPGVQRVHNLRIWALSTNKTALCAHLAVAPNANSKKILQQAITAVHRKFNFFETTLQIEDFIPEMENCEQCLVPTS